jgi:hypothetical protein
LIGLIKKRTNVIEKPGKSICTTINEAELRMTVIKNGIVGLSEECSEYSNWSYKQMVPAAIPRISGLPYMDCISAQLGRGKVIQLIAEKLELLRTKFIGR